MTYPTSPSPAITLGEQINIATRSLHTRLNKSITSRLPLCLPPNFDSPEIYTFGFAHFAHIYLTFERAWGLVVQEAGDRHDQEHEADGHQWVEIKPYAETLKEGIEHDRDRVDLLRGLASLRPSGLTRSERIYDDFSALQKCGDARNQDFLNSILDDSPALQAFISHIDHTVSSCPHVLLAYAWTMYMAVFSGGRWIRGELQKAGPGFWTDSSSNAEDSMNRKLSFWSFPGVQDGLDIKMDFKNSLAEIEQHLSVKQREEIVQEAIVIFNMCLTVVDELDDRFGGLKTVSSNTPVPIAPVRVSNPAALSLPSNQILGAAAVGLGISAWLATAGSGYLGFLLQ